MTKLTLRHRMKDGKPVVSPFIDGWNVWDINPAHWAVDVEAAILHAYELGWQHCNAARVDPPNPHLLGQQFEDSTND